VIAVHPVGQRADAAAHLLLGELLQVAQAAKELPGPHGLGQAEELAAGHVTAGD
jgi:hypothetical protein